MSRIYVLGRSDSCDIRVANDEYASPRHARVTVLADGRAYVEDLGSTNGTYLVFGGRVAKVRLPVAIKPGDIIRIGRTSVTWNGEPA